jgi:hypothetical protein
VRRVFIFTQTWKLKQTTYFFIIIEPMIHFKPTNDW